MPSSFDVETDVANTWNGECSRHAERKPAVSIPEIPSVSSVNSDGIAWAVDGVVAEAAVTGLTGDSGSGKSTLATYIAGCVVTGSPCFARKVSQRKVLVLDRENTAPTMQDRLSRLHVQDGGDLKIWGSWLAEEAPEPGAACVLEWAVSCEPKPLVIVDTFVRFLEGDENDAKSVAALMDQARRLANLGCAVMMLHHVGKAETARDYRGSSDFKASIDVGLNLANFGEGRLTQLRLRPFKTRFSADADLILHYADGEFTCDERPEAVTLTVAERLADLLRQNPGLTVRAFQDVAVKAGLGRDRARRFLMDGVSLGTVRPEKGSKNSRLHYLSEVKND